MGVYERRSIVTSSLLHYLDAINAKCYSGSGSVYKNLAGTNEGSLPGYVYDTALKALYRDPSFVGNPSIYPNLSLGSCNNTTHALWFRWDGTNVSATLSYHGNAGSTGMGLRLHDGIGADPGNKVGIFYGGKYYNVLYGGRASGAQFITLTPNKWMYIVLTRDGSTSTLYSDGVFVGNTAASFQPNPITAESTFFYGQPLEGHAAIYQYYNKCLTAAEVLQNFEAQRRRFSI